MSPSCNPTCGSCRKHTTKCPHGTQSMPAGGQGSKATRKSADGSLGLDAHCTVLHSPRGRCGRALRCSTPCCHLPTLSLSPHSPGTRRIPQNGMLPWGSENPLPYFQARTNTSKISTNPFQMLHMSQKRARGSVAPETKRLSSRVLFHLPGPAA